MLTNLMIDYNWFFSTLSQSLASLIGISGLFIVYRLQIQENRLTEAVRALQRYLSKHDPEKLFYLEKEETIELAENKIAERERLIVEQTGILKGFEEKLKNKQGLQSSLENEIANCKNRIQDDNNTILNLNIREKAITGIESYKNIILQSALVTIVYLTVLFFLSMVGLMYSKYLEKNTKLGNDCILSTFILLFIGLILLLICCAESLNFGRPAIKEFFKSIFHRAKRA